MMTINCAAVANAEAASRACHFSRNKNQSGTSVPNPARIAAVQTCQPKWRSKAFCSTKTAIGSTNGPANDDIKKFFRSDCFAAGLERSVDQSRPADRRQNRHGGEDRPEIRHEFRLRERK